MVLPSSTKQVAIVVLDEMHSHVGDKNYCWICIAVDKLVQRFISCIIGDRAAQV